MKKGIDVSYCQGNIDFSKIDKNQVQFVIIRSSYGWEANQKDSKFEQNYEGFKKLGIPVGAYHYSYAKTKEQAVMEAKYCLECIKGKKEGKGKYIYESGNYYIGVWLNDKEHGTDVSGFMNG